MGRVHGETRCGVQPPTAGEGHPRVLVVEDDYLMAEQICDLLAGNGFQPVGPVPSAERAIELALSQPLEAGVLDVRLRDGLVFGVCHVLRRKGVPFLFVTGSVEEVLRERIEAPIVPKPFDPAELIEVLRLVMGTGD